MTPLPPYEKNQYVKTRTMKAGWYLSSYKYKFNLSRISVVLRDAKRTKVMLQGFKDKVILGLKCRSCNTVSFPPRLICGRCLVKPDQWVRLPDTASVATGSATYEEDDTERERPFPVISVRQDGSDTCWVSNLPEGLDFDSVYIGMPLKAVWADDRKGLWNDITHYEPIEDPANELNKKEGSA